MSTLQTTRIQDQSKKNGAEAAPVKMDYSLFLGTWDNTDANSTGITRVQFRDKDGALMMLVFGVTEAGQTAWEEVEVTVLADDVDSSSGTKFSAVHEFDFMQIRIHGWVKLGILVFAVFNQFTDGSNRSNYFDREFFCASPGS